MPRAIQHRLTIQYDGTNGSFIAGTWCTAITFVSDTGTVLTYQDIDSNNQTANLNDWLIITQVTDGYPSVHTPTQYANLYTELPTGVTLGAGYALTPSITGSGGTANVAVDLDTTMSGTAYEATAVLTGTSALLTDLEITDVTITDSNTVTVEVTNNGALALAGATVIVTAGELTT